MRLGLQDVEPDDVLFEHRTFLPGGRAQFAYKIENVGTIKAVQIRAAFSLPGESRIIKSELSSRELDRIETAWGSLDGFPDRDYGIRDAIPDDAHSIDTQISIGGIDFGRQVNIRELFPDRTDREATVKLSGLAPGDSVSLWLAYDYFSLSVDPFTSVNLFPEVGIRLVCDNCEPVFSDPS